MLLLPLIRMRLATVFVGAPICPDAYRRLANAALYSSFTSLTLVTT